MIFYYDNFSPDSLSGFELDQFLALGWYRMHQSLFTTSHVELGERYRVHWLRYPLLELVNHASHNRIRSRAKKFHFAIEDFEAVRTDHVELHGRYRAFIDFDGALSLNDCLFGDHTGQSIFNTKCISVYDGDKLIAGGYFDLGATSAASIIHFYDPRYGQFSLGKLLILLTTDYLRLNGYEFYYPGYVVEGLSKMDYKLFLGKQEARYFNPEKAMWEYFQEGILAR